MLSFKDLAIGETFRFASGLWPHWCVKTSARCYKRAERDDAWHFTVGAIRVLVIRPTEDDNELPKAARKMWS